MGSEDKVDEIDWYENNNLSSRNQPPSPSLQNHHKQQDSYNKLLTLPTVLTLGRVAAVPLLISSTFHFLDFSLPHICIMSIILIHLIV